MRFRRSRPKGKFALKAIAAMALQFSRSAIMALGSRQNTAARFSDLTLRQTKRAPGSGLLSFNKLFSRTDGKFNICRTNRAAPDYDSLISNSHTAPEPLPAAAEHSRSPRILIVVADPAQR